MAKTKKVKRTNHDLQNINKLCRSYFFNLISLSLLYQQKTRNSLNNQLKNVWLKNHRDTVDIPVLTHLYTLTKIDSMCFLMFYL